jgi:hypothetical protein
MRKAEKKKSIGQRAKSIGLRDGSVVSEVDRVD